MNSSLSSSSRASCFSLGVDIGSISVKTALLDGKGGILGLTYTRHWGQPALAGREAVLTALSKVENGKLLRVGLTGTGASLIAGSLKTRPTNEIIAIISAVDSFLPEVRTVIDIGGEDSKILCLSRPQGGKMVLEDFETNSACAAGTGSFLDQQATRLGISIKDFAELALCSERPPAMAGRCSVFAKSDMIHLQQEGCPDYDIIAGLCAAMARNFISVVASGKPIVSKIALVGGVASNKGMVRAFNDLVGQTGQELVVAENHKYICAIGCAKIASDKAQPFPAEAVREALAGRQSTHAPARREARPRLNRPDSSQWHQPETMERRRGDEGIHLGLDVGSVSTNIVALDKDLKVIARCYLPTAGRPIEAVRKGINEVGKQLGFSSPVLSVGTTGSGRYLIGDFIGADVVKNEITAQATAAVAIDPQVDTIFEIGGQDSKYISLRNGAVVDSCMNKVCAAGTGSFLEEQAERLGISIVGEFGEKALSAKKPAALGERCTVFMESSLISSQQEGAQCEDLCAGLSYSVAENYLNRVVGERRIGDRIFFQGAVAFNQGVTAALRQLTGKPITVPENHDVTGAIGAARVAAAEKAPTSGSAFKGFEVLHNASYNQRSFVCEECSNSCEIREVIIEGEEPLRYGSRCGRFDERVQRSGSIKIQDLFTERASLQRAAHREMDNPKSGTIGIPLSMLFYEYLPLWTETFQMLGFSVVYSDVTTARTVRLGSECSGMEICLPVKAAHGHMKKLLEMGVDYIFLPGQVNGEDQSFGMGTGFNCPYVQSLPFMVSACGTLEEAKDKLLSPVLVPGLRKGLLEKGLQAALRPLGIGAAEIKRALHEGRKAQAEFYMAMQKRGREVLSQASDKVPVIVLVARPYNSCDPGLSLDLPQKLRKLGALPIPLDMLPLDSVDLSGAWPNMYWRYGQRILAAAQIIRDNDRLNALYVTNFACGPDSFIMRYFTAEMAGKPYLSVDIDEHSSDVGMVTRLEAFLDSLKNASNTAPGQPPRPSPPVASAGKRRVYIPRMGAVSPVSVAAFHAYGLDAEMYPESNEDTLYWGRLFTNGRECFPCIVTVGDMVRVVKSPGFDPGRAAFFMPTTAGSCRFGQYNCLQRMVLEELGYPDVPVLAPNQAGLLSDELKSHGAGFFRLAWWGIAAIDIITQLVRKVRPYELTQGDADEVHSQSIEKICAAIEKKQSPVTELERAASQLDSIRTDRSEQRPRIGIVGEIFVRNSEFCNNSAIRQIERLGGEVAMPPVSEWLYHISHTTEYAARLRRRYGLVAKAKMQRFLQRRDEMGLFRAASQGFSDDGILDEASIENIWANAEPYIPPYFGEIALSAGKSTDYVRHGYAGIVNLMPFGCLPGTITTVLLRRLREDHGRIPFISLSFDGIDQSAGETRLEAFIHQARQFDKRRCHIHSGPDLCKA